MRIAEINQHAVAHILGDKAAKPADGVGDAAVIGTDDLARSSGSNRVDSGVEPTRSQNITVSCRRSASLEAADVTAEVGSEALSVAMASSSLRRWPTEVTPMLIRSSAVSFGSTSARKRQPRVGDDNPLS